MERKMTPEQWEEAKKLKEQGVTSSAIAERFGISQGRISQKLGKHKPKPEPVAETV